MRLYVGFLSVLALTCMLKLITCADSPGKSRNREDRFDLENESFNNQESDELTASCESTESVEVDSCRQGKNKYPTRKTFKFAI
ncbi:uncharacterized protein LOC26535406 [Drosophila yakuba]|uniref:Drosophila melanogaster n=1 Tax=Drosophila yakuba TaxID=7245 RepID=A0A0R1E3R4_DROYA|nr:uncharacterized protein LOC26535406 [Drosophila yakuba]KRK01911.1 uncharacterized protein Dyak_GE28225 [Drosophila yakuba]